MSPSELEFYPAVAAAYGAGLYFVMLAVAQALTRVARISREITVQSGRYGALDGLRGVLAAGVLTHHSFSAYEFFTTGEWEWSSSPILNHLGQTTVALFFMVTGFLFAMRVASGPIVWKPFYLARLARLLPLYAAVVAAVFVAVFWLSGWTLREPAWVVAKEAVQWLAFVCFGRPDINAFPLTWTLIAGVNWSLKYEVAFYLSCVPALALISRLLSPRQVLMGVAVLLLSLLLLRVYRGAVKDGHLLYITHFLCGIFAACVYRDGQMSVYLRSRALRWVAAASVALFFVVENSYSAAAVVAAALVFLAVLGGASMGGVLRTRAALWLGDISYGIYLIHGLVLWLTVFTLKSHVPLESISLTQYSAFIATVGVAVVFLATFSYIALEKPAMTWAKQRAKSRSTRVAFNSETSAGGQALH